MSSTDSNSLSVGTEDIQLTTSSLEKNRSARRDDAVAEDLQEYPSGAKFWLPIIALCLGGFLSALDSTVVATAVPAITDEFHSIKDIGWYSSIYFLTMCMPQLPLVKINDRYPIRWTYSIAMAVFLAGSAVCGSAPNSSALIAGRALAGLGASGLFVSSNALVPYLAPGPKRPIYFGLFVAAMASGVGSGPIIGGVFTQNVTWRWNFYMNIPIGGLIYCIFFLFVHPPPPTRPTPPVPFRDFLKTLDFPGLVTLAPSVVCFQTALQWGGTTYQWNNARVISLLVLSGVLFIAFVVNEIWQGDNAMMPARILKQRNVICAVFFCFCSNGAGTVLTYYLPIWFQGVRGDTPIQSGVDTLPLVITIVITSILGGALMTLWRQVGLFMVIESVFTAIGAGLLTTLDINTSTGKWIGYQILFAVGTAAGRLGPIVCLQNILDPEDIPYGYTLITFDSFMAGAIWVSVAQALFANYFLNDLQGLGLPTSEAATALAGGINTITDGLSGEAATAMLRTLNNSIVHAWHLPVVLCCIGFLATLAIDHRRIRRAGAGGTTEAYAA